MQWLIVLFLGGDKGNCPLPDCLEQLTLEMLAYGRQSLPVRISWQGFSGKSLQSS